jgi:hypothetical protein
MRVFKPYLRGIGILFIIGLFFSQSAGQAEDPMASKTGKSGLVRMDLLRHSPGESRPFRRNIFTPGPASGGPLSPGVPVPLVSPGRQNSQNVQLPADEMPTEAVQPAFNINLRYVGFIVSPRRLIALIILDGQALAVAEGEVVSEGVRIGKITAGEIEVVLPDSSTRKFSLEGE